MQAKEVRKTANSLFGYSAVLVSLLAFSAGAQAAPMTYTETTSFTLDNYVSYSDGLQGDHQQVQTINLAGYDSSRGSLTGVVIEFDATVQLNAQLSAGLIDGATEGDCYIFCSPSNDGSPSGFIDGDYILDATGLPAFGGIESTSLSTDVIECEFDGDSCRSDMVNLSQSFNGLLFADNTPGLISAFIDQETAITAALLSTGFVYYNCEDPVYQFCTIDGNLTFSGDITVTYHYDTEEVAEPATIALMGLGLLGLGAARRRVL